MIMNMKRISLFKMSHYSEANCNIKNKITVELGFSNYARNSDSKMQQVLVYPNLH